MKQIFEDILSHTTNTKDLNEDFKKGKIDGIKECIKALDRIHEYW